MASNLIDDGYNADALHGDLSQVQRDTVMQKFRVRTLQLLVATDVAARGLDVDDLTHVINYSLPDDLEVYTHRSGRTGRAGKTGLSISLVHLRERYVLQQIERKIKKQIKPLPIPTGSEICGKQLFHWVRKIENVATEHPEIEKFLPEIKIKLEGLDREELLRRIVSLEFDRFLDDYRFGHDIISPLPEREMRDGKSEKRDRGEKSGGKYTRLFINLGKTDGFFPEQLIELVNKNSPGMKIPIGKIDLLKTFSFFEVPEAYAEDMIKGLNNSKFMDRRVAVEVAQEKPMGFRSDFNSEKRSGKRPGKWSDKSKDSRPARNPGGFSKERRGKSRDKKNKY